MFGGSAKSSGGFMGGGSSESNSILPNMFQDEPACAGMCPNLSYKHRYELSADLLPALP